MIVEWEMTMKCNYKCAYCGLLDSSIKDNKQKNDLIVFLDDINNKYKDTRLFIFGGEPTLHPEFNFCIDYLNKLHQPFVIQTNFSREAFNKLQKIKEPTNINISIHQDEFILEDFISDFKNLNKNIIVNDISFMFLNQESLVIYKKLKECGISSTLTPISDFKVDGFGNSLRMYNKYKKIFKDIYDFEEGERSQLWEDQLNGINSFKYQPCKYKNDYVLFDSQLKKYSCCYRENNDICLHDRCFIM